MSGGGAPKRTMRGRFHHRKGCGGRESRVELEIWESNAGQCELSVLNLVPIYRKLCRTQVCALQRMRTL